MSRSAAQATSPRSTPRALPVPAVGLPAWGFALAGLALAATVTFWHLILIRPLDSDNLGALSWAARAGPTDFARGQPLSYPEWRPLAYLTIWAQYQVVGLRLVESYFLLNVLLWAGCAFLVYLLVARLTRSPLSGLLVGLALLFDGRAIEALKWITGRQSTLACLFGLSVLVFALVRPPAAWRWPAWAFAFCSLLAAGLSKEYGLAYGGAFLVQVLLQPRTAWRTGALVVAGVLPAYLGLRLLLAGGAGGDYCAEMGFFSADRLVCYRDLDASSRLQQHLYNVGATLVGTVLPDLFTSTGTFKGIGSMRGLAPVLWISLAIVGWLTAPRRTLPLLALVLLNAALSVMLYRGRNQLVAIVGLYATAGLGLAYLLARTRRPTVARLLAGLILAVGFWGVGNQAIRVRNRSEIESRRIAVGDLCVRLWGNPSRFEPEVVRLLKLKYNLPNPDCARPAAPASVSRGPR